MDRLYMEWLNVGEEGAEEVLRRCQGCGKKVIFKDSMVRRENANGKNIYRWAIYKCEKGHTWNRKLKDFKAHSDMRDNIAPDTPSKLYRRTHEEQVESVHINEDSSLSEIMENGYEEIVIKVRQVLSRVRLDLLVSQRFTDISRSRAKKMIERGEVLINDAAVKGNSFVKEDCEIRVVLN